MDVFFGLYVKNEAKTLWDVYKLKRWIDRLMMSYHMGEGDIRNINGKRHVID